MRGAAFWGRAAGWARTVDRAQRARFADYPTLTPHNGHVGYQTAASLLEPSRTGPPRLAVWSARLHFELVRTWLKLGFPERGFVAFARLAVIDQGPSFSARFTAPELTSLAKAAHTAGRGREANGVLRSLIAKTPRNAAPRVALVNILLEANSYRDAEIAALDAARHFPSDPDVLLRLARVQSQLRRFDEAMPTLERLLKIDNAHGWAWFEYGRAARECHDDSGLPSTAFQRAGELAGDDAALLEAVARQFSDNLDHASAVEFYERLLSRDRRARIRPATLRRYALALKGCGRPGQADLVNGIALRNCRILGRLRRGDAWEDLKQEESLLLLEAGRERESEHALRAVRRRRIGHGPRFDRPEYLPGTEQRLRELRQIVGARDVFVLLQGPSLADFASRIGDFAKFDFAVATLSAFPPVEQVLSQISRLVDILLVTHPSTVRSWYPEFCEFLARPTRNLTLTTRYALSALFEFGTTSEAFIERHDERLLLAHPLQGPPLPGKPLHF